MNQPVQSVETWEFGFDTIISDDDDDNTVGENGANLEGSKSPRGTTPDINEGGIPSCYEALNSDGSEDDEELGVTVIPTSDALGDAQSVGEEGENESADMDNERFRIGPNRNEIKAWEDGGWMEGGIFIISRELHVPLTLYIQQ